MIEVKNLVKKYGDFEAVRDVSFSVDSVEVLGFLGPNGAGKTTIMKILTGSLFPSDGQVIVDGISVAEDPVAVKSRIGYLPENVPLYGDMNGEEYLHFAAAARLLPKARRKNAVDRAVESCGLEGFRYQRIENLSKGYRQRVGLAQAIIHDPPILILDEPTSGLDPNQIIEIRALIRELGKTKAVILSTNILQEVEAVCSRVLILNEGRIAAQGRPEDIAGNLNKNEAASGVCESWELRIKGTNADELEKRLDGLKSLHPLRIHAWSVKMADNGTVLLSLLASGEENDAPNDEGSGDSGERLFDWVVSQGWKIIEMNRKKPSLEDIFVRLTNDALTGEAQISDRNVK